jgi:hypothetical protein
MRVETDFEQHAERGVAFLPSDITMREDGAELPPRYPGTNVRFAISIARSCPSAPGQLRKFTLAHYPAAAGFDHAAAAARSCGPR